MATVGRGAAALPGGWRCVVSAPGGALPAGSPRAKEAGCLGRAWSPSVWRRFSAGFLRAWPSAGAAGLLRRRGCRGAEAEAGAGEALVSSPHRAELLSGVVKHRNNSSGVAGGTNG